MSLVAPMIFRVQHTDASPLDDELRADVTLRLEQHRIHVRRWRHPASDCLKRGRAPDFAAIDRDGRVIRHVLRLEWPDAMAAI